MARLIIEVEVDVDPTLEDPHEVAQTLLGDDHDYPTTVFVGAEWSK